MKIGKLYITWGKPPATVIQMDAKDLTRAIDAQIASGLGRSWSPSTGTTVRW